jgi:hypothetical protein
VFRLAQLALADILSAAEAVLAATSSAVALCPVYGLDACGQEEPDLTSRLFVTRSRTIKRSIQGDTGRTCLAHAPRAWLGPMSLVTMLSRS